MLVLAGGFAFSLCKVCCLLASFLSNIVHLVVCLLACLSLFCFCSSGVLSLNHLLECRRF